ncbi:MAG: hypothetical protein FWG06_03380 [Clostridiales bacterium]|nr:hypothetical protein [Clostridiales bacterium]
MNEKKQSPLFGVGGVTLLTVLLVLALTMFAVLTLSSAQADMRLSEKNARAVRDYYAADAQAVRLQAAVAELWSSDRYKPQPEEIRDALLNDFDLAVADWDDGFMIFCDIPINEAGHILQLTLFLAPPGTAGRWRTEQWQFVPPPTVFDFEPGLPVWIGD